MVINTDVHAVLRPQREMVPMINVQTVIRAPERDGASDNAYVHAVPSASKGMVQMITRMYKPFLGPQKGMMPMTVHMYLLF